MLDKLKGNKTYIVAGISIVWAIAGAVLGYMEPSESMNIVLAALAAAGLRNAI